MVAKDIDQSGNETAVIFDVGGNSSFDTSLGTGTTGLDYWTFGEYLGVNNAFEQIVSALPFQVAATSAPHPRGGSRQKSGTVRTEFIHYVPANPGGPQFPQYDTAWFKKMILLNVESPTAHHTFRRKQEAIHWPALK